VAVVVLTSLTAGCSSDAGWSGRSAGSTSVGTLGSGFTDPATPPSPEATVTPVAGSWDGVSPPPGYRVVLLTAGDDAPTSTLVTAVTTWAQEEDAELKVITADPSDHLPTRIDEAVALAPDLIVSAGNDLVDALTVVSPHHLDQQFLVVGAELAEPTANVTAADWTGASFRGEGLGMSSTYDPASFTPERADRAVRAGVAAVLNGLTGVVIWLH
jgi:hypothetical protein